MKIYRDGALFHSGSDKWRTLGVPTSFRLLGGGGLAGKFDDMRVYSVELTAPEISAIYNDDLPVALIPYVSTDSEGRVVFRRSPLHLRGAEIMRMLPVLHSMISLSQAERLVI